MYIVYGNANIFLPYCSSLKEKRKIIQSIIARIRKRFNISIAEVEHQDLWQRTKLGFCAVTGIYGEIDLFINAINETIDLYTNEIEVIEFQYKIIS